MSTQALGDISQPAMDALVNDVEQYDADATIFDASLPAAQEDLPEVPLS